MKTVIIGGGNGASEVVLGLLEYYPSLIHSENITIITPVTDNGRSTGVARAIFNIPAPGDTRNSILKLSKRKKIANLLQRRIKIQNPELQALEGMSIGNLLLGSLVEESGGIVEASAVFAEQVGCKVKVVPISNSNVDIIAFTEDGEKYEGELNVRKTQKARIDRLILSDSTASAHSVAINAIIEADIIIFGPGCLYTSIIASLLFDGVKNVLKESTAVKIYICNSTTQPGQTDGYTCLTHIKEILNYAGLDGIEYAIFNDKVSTPQERLDKFGSLGVFPITPSGAEKDEISRLVRVPIYADLLEETDEDRSLWNKLDTLRYDQKKLSTVIVEIFSYLQLDSHNS